MLRGFVHERHCGALQGACTLVGCGVEFDDVEGQVVAGLALEPGLVHCDRDVAVVVLGLGGGEDGGALGAGNVGVVEFDGYGRVDGVVVGVPCY